MDSKRTPTKIFPYLYLGSHAQCKNKDNLRQLGITDIIITDEKIEEAFVAAEKAGKANDFEYFVFNADDTQESKLFVKLDQAVEFILEAKKEGNVLVQCPTGNSRGAAVCAAFLMKLRTDLSFDDAVDTIQAARPSVHISEGLKISLLQWYLDFHPEQKAAEEPESQLTDPKSLESQSTEQSKLEASNHEPQLAPKPAETTDQPHPKPTEIETPQPVVPVSVEPPSITHDVDHYGFLSTQSGDPIEKKFVCRNCRTPIFTNKDVLTHEQGKGQQAFGYNKRSQLTDTITCTSYFLDEMEWMGNCYEAEGKLFCPNCQHRVGSWSWSGAQCSCGAWITPSFRISNSRVDVKV